MDIAVVGTGTIGAQIAYTLAAFGSHTVRLFDSRPESVTRAISQAEEWAATVEPLTQGRLLGAPTLEEALEGVELVIEAVPEDLELKRTVFAQMSALTESTILATNSSSLKSSALVQETRNPGRLLNLHFYPEPWKRNVVELMTCGETDPAVMRRTADIMSGCRLTPIILEGESTGLLFNRIWRAVKKECLRLAAEGVGKPEDVDTMWRILWGTPVGPFRLMDIVGLDVVLDIERTYARESGDPRDEPPQLLIDMVRRGDLGKKTGQGFYKWSG